MFVNIEQYLAKNLQIIPKFTAMEIKTEPDDPVGCHFADRGMSPALQHGV